MRFIRALLAISLLTLGLAACTPEGDPVGVSVLPSDLPQFEVDPGPEATPEENPTVALD